MYEYSQIVNSVPGIPGPPGPQGPPSTIAERLIKTYAASEPISAMKLVYLTSPTEVGVGSSTTYEKALIAGVALNAASTGQDVEVLMFGLVADAVFSYSVNEVLFLSSSGSITNVAPVTGYSVIIGKGLGAGNGFIKISETVTL